MPGTANLLSPANSLGNKPFLDHATNFIVYKEGRVTTTLLRWSWQCFIHNLTLTPDWAFSMKDHSGRIWLSFEYYEEVDNFQSIYECAKLSLFNVPCSALDMSCLTIVQDLLHPLSFTREASRYLPRSVYKTLNDRTRPTSFSHHIGSTGVAQWMAKRSAHRLTDEEVPSSVWSHKNLISWANSTA